MATQLSGAEEIFWNLEDVYPGEGAPDLHKEVEEAVAGSKAFSERYRGKVAELDARGLAEAVAEAERIVSLIYRAAAWAQMYFTTDTTDAPRGALMQMTQEKYTAVTTEMLFFDLELVALDDARAEELLSDPALETYSHYLRQRRAFKPYRLSEPEERILSEKSTTARNAWSRLFEELNAALRIKIEGEEEELGFEVAMSRLHLPDPEARRKAAEAVTRALQEQLRTFTFIFNTVLLDKATNDRIRGYPHWLKERNLGNQASDEAVEALIKAVVSRYDIPNRYYALKAKMLGREKINDWDRFAPITDDDTHIPWSEAEKIIRKAYESFSDESGKIIGDFFDKKWIDAAPTKVKATGAYCMTTFPGAHPYMLMSYTGDRRSVLVLAHELGHGLHGALAGKHGLFNASSPLTMAETASVFGEAITFGMLLEAESDPKKRLDLLAGQLDDAIATSFRQIALNRFEDKLHELRRSDGELSPERISEIWYEVQSAILGPAVEISDGYRTSWWSYISHFVALPGYVYAYSFGYLFSLAIYNKYLTEGDAMIEPYLDLLRAGGSDSPENLAAKVGLDLSDPGFWHQGLDAMDRQLAEAEKLAAEVL